METEIRKTLRTGWNSNTYLTLKAYNKYEDPETKIDCISFGISAAQNPDHYVAIEFDFLGKEELLKIAALFTEMAYSINLPEIEQKS